MRSFIVSIIATLAFALFAVAAPTPALAAPVNAIAARADDKPTFEKTFTKCIDGVKPHADKLAGLKVGVEVEVVAKIVADIVVVIKVAIEEVKIMAGLKFEDVFCDSNGVLLSVTVIASLCVKLMVMIFSACASVLACITVDIKVQICAILSELLCLLGDLICAVLDICVSLRVQIIACILPQIAVCIKLIFDLNIEVFIKALALIK